jgi:hypothetical protein
MLPRPGDFFTANNNRTPKGSSMMIKEKQKNIRKSKISTYSEKKKYFHHISYF